MKFNLGNFINRPPEVKTATEVLDIFKPTRKQLEEALDRVLYIQNGLKNELSMEPEETRKNQIQKELEEIEITIQERRRALENLK